MALAFLPVYIQILGLEAYGLIGFFAVLQGVLAIFDFGITPTVTREAARQRAGAVSAVQLRNLVRTFEYLASIGAVTLMLGVVLCSDLVAERWINAETLANSSIVQSISLMGLILAARLLEGVYRGLLIGLSLQVRFNVIQACVATVRYSGAVIVLMYGSANVSVFFAWQAVLSLISLLFMFVEAYKYLPAASSKPRFSVEVLRSVLGFSTGVGIIGVLSIAMVNIDRLVLSRSLSLEGFGYYALAAVAASVLYTLVVPITQAFYPRMVAQAGGSHQGEMIRSFRLVNQFVAVFVGVAAIFLSIFSHEVLFVWSGESFFFEHTSAILQVLALAAYATCIGHIGVSIQQARGAIWGVVAVNGLMVALSVFALSSIAGSYGALAAARVWLILAVLQTVLIFFLVYKNPVKFYSLKNFICDIFLPSVGGGIVAIVAQSYQVIFEGRLSIALFLALHLLIGVFVSMLIAPSLRKNLISFFYAHLR